MTFFAPCRAWRTAAATAMLLGAGALWADTLSPEDKLAAIRKGLVQAALEGPTQVSATQWIDGNGALHELSAFRSGMKVRGVRVLAYGTDAQGEPTAKLQWQHSDGGEGSAKPAAQCKTPLTWPLQHVLAWSWSSNSPWGADQAPVLNALQSSVLAQLQGAGAASAQWRLVEAMRTEGRSSYQQALLGSNQDELPWQLHFQLLGAPNRAPDAPVAVPNPAPRAELPGLFSASPDSASLTVQLRMTLTARNQLKPTLQSSAVLQLNTVDDNWGSPGLSALAREKVAQQVQAWSQTLQQSLACLPVLADVTQAAGALVRINAGSASGVRVGDEWVLAQDRSAVQGALESGAAGQSVLAKVQSVGTYYAMLRPIAGKSQNIQTHWTAWSAEASR